MQKQKKISNGEVLYTEKDITPEKMKKVNEMFKGIEHITIPMSGAKFLEKIRKLPADSYF